MIKLTNDKAAAVDQNYYWQALGNCPKSTKVQLLTTGGVAVYGQYVGQDGFIGWAPLPNVPSWMKI